VTVEHMSDISDAELSVIAAWSVVVD
jgi:hypothetical protein